MAIISSTTLANRIGFIVLGFTSSFAYVIMLSAAYDLLEQIGSHEMLTDDGDSFAPSANLLFNYTSALNHTTATSNGTGSAPYCNKRSTSTVLLANSLPSLTLKLIYPFLFASVPSNYKVAATAILMAMSFLITGISSSKYLVFFGVGCASLASGLSETTFLSNASRYETNAICSLSIGMGMAGLLASFTYATLKMVLTLQTIMSIMMVLIPSIMLLAYFFVIRPVPDEDDPSASASPEQPLKKEKIRVSVISSASSEDSSKPIWNNRKTQLQIANYGVATTRQSQQQQQQQQQESVFMNHNSRANTVVTCEAGPMAVFQYDNKRSGANKFGCREKLKFLPSLAGFFVPLFLVYFAEYFINQGLHELIYYPEITTLDHAAQYRWFQVVYQTGVMVSRSSLDFIVIRYLWTMAFLQVSNAVLFLCHVAKVIHIPNFYLILAIIFYEGLLGGSVYANTFFRMREVLAPNRLELAISSVVVGDTLGIVTAGLCALPVHDELCKLYV